MSSSSAIFKLSPLIGNCVFSEILSQIYIKQAHSERRRERKKKKKKVVDFTAIRCSLY